MPVEDGENLDALLGGKPQWGERVEKLVFTPLLVSIVDLLNKLHAVCST